jgi:hypothetical protein
VVRQTFQPCPVWMHTQSNITNIIFTWVHNTNKEKKKKMSVGWSDVNCEAYYMCNTSRVYLWASRFPHIQVHKWPSRMFKSCYSSAVCMPTIPILQ